MSEKKIDLQQKIVDKVRSQTEKDATASSVYKPYYNVLDKQKPQKKEVVKKPVTKPEEPKRVKKKPVKPSNIKVKQVKVRKSIFDTLLEFLKIKRKLKIPVLYPENNVKTAKKSSFVKVFVFSLISFIFVAVASFILYVIVSVSKNDISYTNNSDANDQFLYIASRGSSEELNKLVNNFDIDFTSKDERGRNALSLALMYNYNVDIIADLISYGVDINDKDSQGFTPLMHALLAYKGSDLILEIINLTSDINATTNTGTSVLMTAIATSTDIALIKLLIAKGADVNYKNENSVTALMIAAKEAKDPEVIKLLLEQGADPFVVDKKGANALDIAMTNSNLNDSDALFKLEMLFRKKNDKESGNEY